MTIDVLMSRRTLRSGSRIMGLTAEDKAFLSSMLASLESKLSDRIQQLEENLVARIQNVEQEVSTQQTTIDDQARRLTLLETHIAEQDKKIVELTMQTNSVAQYTRRESVRIHGLPPSDSSTETKIMATVKRCHEAIGVAFDENSIARAHRIGQPVSRGGASTHSIIVKFRHFKAKEAFYKARP